MKDQAEGQLPAEVAEDTGPYRVYYEEGAEKSAKTWGFERRPGHTPNVDQIAYGTRITAMIVLLAEVKDTSKNGETIEHLFKHGARLFRTTLVRENHEDMAQFKGHADTYERRICRDVARPAHRRTVVIRQWWAFFFAIVGVLLAMGLAEFLTRYAPTTAVEIDHMDNLLFLFCGASLGRCVGLLMSFYAPLTKLSDYRVLQDDLAHPREAALNDIVLAIVAYMVFSTGFMEIAFGGNGENPGMSSSLVDDSYPMALIFGLVVGIARAGFLERVTNIATQNEANSKD